MSQQTRHDASFILRIWWERCHQDTVMSVWRGQVQHVASGETAGFRDMTELWDFVQRWTGVVAPNNDTRSENGSPPGSG